MKLQLLFIVLVLAFAGVFGTDAAPATETFNKAQDKNEDAVGDDDQAGDDEKLLEELFDEEFFAAPQLSETELKEVTSWAGHLKPLGTGNEKIPVAEVTAFPGSKDFYNDYVIKSMPVVIRGGANNQAAKSKWTDEYLKSSANADKLRVYVENNRKEDRTQASVELPNLPFFKDWVDSYAKEDKFMISDVVNALKADYTLPESLQCDSIKPTLMRGLVHLNGGNTRSVLHHEHYEDIHCVLDGEKTFLLANPATNSEHLFIDADDEETGEYVAVDVDSVDATKYPHMRKVTFYESTLKAGDCIFIPSTWMQADRTTDKRQVAVSVWWARDDAVDEAISTGKCEKTGEWTLDKQQFADEVTLLMMNDDERKEYLEKKEKDEQAAYEAELAESAKAAETVETSPEKKAKDEL